MKTNEFLSLLGEHKHRELVFLYENGKQVGANYHITEVKSVQIDAVDCGAGSDSWKETVIQLWESPKEQDKKDFMSANKALGILNRVSRIKPLDGESQIRFEYGNNSFHTAQLYVDKVSILENRLLVKLSVESVACKAGDICGVPAEQSVAMDSGCSPASGCC